MATDAQIRGMLLEEVLLSLLRSSGYRTITSADVASDPTLRSHRAGISIVGRGGIHQIDAIADFTVAHPFSHPQRLLVEAKCLKGAIGLEVARNAVGVLKDVSEHWITVQSNKTPGKRYHYQYALFSASGYSHETEQYAFAQDVYLIPLANSLFFQPILKSIFGITTNAFKKNGRRLPSLSSIRSSVRAALQQSESWEADLRHLINYESRSGEMLDTLLYETRQMRIAILGMINAQFPILLIPNPKVPLASLLEPQNVLVRVSWNQRGWYLRSVNTNELLYSFDLPPELFELYASQGLLSAKSAIRLKEEQLNTIQAVVTINDRIQVQTFQLDQEWLSGIREDLKMVKRDV